MREPLKNFDDMTDNEKFGFVIILGFIVVILLGLVLGAMGAVVFGMYKLIIG